MWSLRQWNRKHYPQNRSECATHYCTSCKQNKPIPHFSKSQRRKNSSKRRCSVCIESELKKNQHLLTNEYRSQHAFYRKSQKYHSSVDKTKQNYDSAFTWNCAKCTFQNRGDMKQCEICFTSKFIASNDKQQEQQIEKAQKPLSLKKRMNLPPNNYVCRKCGDIGSHWIMNCEFKGLSSDNKKENETYDKQLDDTDNECVICYDCEKEYLCVPCGHLSLCENCKDSVKECPICRSPCDSIIKLFK
eukprot:263741_1